MRTSRRPFSSALPNILDVSGANISGNCVSIVTFMVSRALSLSKGHIFALQAGHKVRFGVALAPGGPSQRF